MFEVEEMRTCESGDARADNCDLHEVCGTGLLFS